MRRTHDTRLWGLAKSAAADGTIRLALAGVLLIVLAAFMYRQLSPALAAPDGQKKLSVACAACAAESAIEVRPGEVAPYRCPACGRDLAVAMWRCLDCGTRFMPGQTSGIVTCPNCRSDRVGAATTAR